MMPNDIIKYFYEQDLLKPIDVHFARLLQRLDSRADTAVPLAAALVSRARREGHICLDLTRAGEARYGIDAGAMGPWTLPIRSDWLKALRASSVVGEPGDFKPLILDRQGRLFLLRYWEYQVALADSIRQRLNTADADLDMTAVQAGLNRYFGDQEQGEVNWQKIAAYTGLRKKLSIISGGPGTGKTYTVVKILALLIEQAQDRPLRIALAAPTGKGAARLQETIRQIKAALPCTESIKQRIPLDTTTIHRLLKPWRDSPSFQHNRKNPLPLDLLVLDEASMVDLALMSKLMPALPLSARVIILGDRDQLASVEAGAVFGDLCDTGVTHPYSLAHGLELEMISGCPMPVAEMEKESGLQDCIVQLNRNYRFSKTSGIAALSRSINEGLEDETMGLLNRGTDQEEIAWTRLPGPEQLLQALQSEVLPRLRECLGSKDPLEFLHLFEKFRILCALREGPYGFLAINHLVEKILGRAGLIRPQDLWYRGRPILVTKNDYQLGLFNGDTGLVWPDLSAGNDLRVFFPGPEGTFRKYHPLRLPEHQTLYAMTVHKSQGSEFDQVLLILPDRDAPVLTRELIYTAVTRARQKVMIWGREEVLRTAVARRIERMSGLRDDLWGKADRSRATPF